MASHLSSNGSHNQHTAALNNGANLDTNAAPVYAFDPAASPEDKAAVAGQARGKLESVVPNKEDNGRELTVEPTSATLPTITVEDADAPKEELAAEEAPQPSQEAKQEASPMPGAVPDHPAPAIPEWYRVGWREASGIDDPHDLKTREKAVIDTFLSDQFYGSWYHNAAVIVFAVFASHFITRFNFGWGWLFILLAICNTYYTTSLQRVRWRARDDIQRELVKTRLASEHESADWLNNFLDRFWLIYEPVLSSSIVASVDQVLSTNTPAFLDSLRITHFTLGTKAPRIDRVRTFPTTPDDIIMMDWSLSFTPNDISEITPKKAATKINPKIILNVHVGKGFANAALPILVEDITFSGEMRIRMKLMANFPHVQVLDFTFLEKPKIDYVLKPVGGETFGFDIANIPGLATFIHDMTHLTLGPMMYDPNVFTLNLEQMLSGKPLDAAIGILQVTVRSARGIKGTKIGGGTPDPYMTLTFNNRAELARTKYKENTYNPTWMETKFLLIKSLEESLYLHLWDYNDHRKDSLMGFTIFELAQLKDDTSHEDVHTQILLDGKERGEVRYDVNYYPVLEPEETTGADNFPVGIVRLVIHQAKELDHTQSIGDINPVAKVYVGASKHAGFATRKLKRTLSPVWEEAYEFICPDKTSSIVRIDVIDDRDILKDPVIGYMSIRLTDLLESKGEAGRDWFPLSHCKTGKIRISAEWKPLDMPASLHAAEKYVPPIGVVKLLLDKATDLKNVEAALGGKSDPYVRVQINNVTKARTEVVNNNLNPVWDEIVYIPVHSLKETLFLECMDYQNLTKDRSLGSVELQIASLARESSNQRYPYDSTGVKEAVERVRLDKGNYKGELHYKATFIPALALKGVKFETEKDALQGGSDTTSTLSNEEGVMTEVTIKRQSVKSVKSTVSMSTPEAKSNVAEEAGVDKPTQANGITKGVEMSTEELLAQQSGIIVFNVISGNLAKKARVEVALDDGYWPAFSTARARSIRTTWESVGEGFVKEIDFGRVWLRLNEADEGEKDDIIGEWKGDAKAFLHDALNGPHEYTLVDEAGRHSSTIKVEARYIPVPVTLEPRETINNQGVLRVNLLNGENIHAADRGGKSDPYAVFTLNGTKVYKSEVKKKTLSPDWNETFSISVPSRAVADLSVELFDWNQFEQAKSLGRGKIEVNDIEPFLATERVIGLSSAKHGEKGLIRVRLVFEPEIIVKTRKATSAATATFSSAGRAMTQFGAIPMQAGKGVLQVFKKDFREGTEVVGAVPVETAASGESGAAGSATGTGAAEGGKASMDGGQVGGLRVTVVDGEKLGLGEHRAYAVVRVGDREYKTKYTGKTSMPEWDETFKFAAGPLTSKLFLWVHEHKTIGKDKDLGNGEVEIWRHVRPEGRSNAEVTVQLRQGGSVRLRLEFDAELNAMAASMSSGSLTSGAVGENRMSRTISQTGSPSRFSLARARRTIDGRSEDE